MSDTTAAICVRLVVGVIGTIVGIGLGCLTVCG